MLIMGYSIYLLKDFFHQQYYCSLKTHLHAFLLKLLNCHPASIRQDTRAHLRVLPSRKTPQWCVWYGAVEVWNLWPIGTVICKSTVETQTHSIALRNGSWSPSSTCIFISFYIWKTCCVKALSQGLHRAVSLLNDLGVGLVLAQASCWIIWFIGSTI